MRRLNFSVCLLALFLTLACIIPITPRPDLEFDPTQLPPAQVGVKYDAKITVLGNVTPVFSMSVAPESLPEGLTLEYHANDNFATIIGIPTRAGMFKVTVEVSCLGTNVSGQTGKIEYTIEVK